MIVEDGTGLPDANAYISEAELDDYAGAIGATPGGLSAEEAIVRATLWIDATFGSRYPGTRLNGRAQALGWPRTGATDVAGNAVDADSVPVEIKRATAAAALLETTTSGALFLPADFAVKREKLEGLEVEYAIPDSSLSGSVTAPWRSIVDGLLLPLLGGSAMRYPAAYVV